MSRGNNQKLSAPFTKRMNKNEDKFLKSSVHFKKIDENGLEENREKKATEEQKEPSKLKLVTTKVF